MTHTFTPGDRVMFSSAFLLSIFTSVDAQPRSVGVITAIRENGSFPPKATIRWEVNAPGSLYTEALITNLEPA